MRSDTLSSGRQKIVLMVGLPGSGKSTWLDRKRANAISSDEMRRLIADDPADQTIHARVFAAVRYLVRQRIDAGRPVTYIDATNLSRWERRQYLKLAKDRGCDVEAVWIDTPIDVCLERNRRRDRKVPEDVLRMLVSRLEPPSKAEGFTRVVRIRDGADT